MEGADPHPHPQLRPGGCPPDLQPPASHQPGEFSESGRPPGPLPGAGPSGDSHPHPQTRAAGRRPIASATPGTRAPRAPHGANGGWGLGRHNLQRPAVTRGRGHMTSCPRRAGHPFTAMASSHALLSEARAERGHWQNLHPACVTERGAQSCNCKIPASDLGPYLKLIAGRPLEPLPILNNQ